MKRTLFFAAALLFSLPLMAGPDLTISNTVIPSSVKPLGTNFVVQFNLTNIGNVGVSGAKVKVTVPSGASYVNSSSNTGSMACAPYSGYVLCSTIAGGAPIAPSGGFVTIKVTMRANTEGSQSITMQADPDSEVVEDVETNNSVTSTVGFSDLPRVSVRTTACAPSPRAPNQVYYATFVLKNNGTLPVRYPGLKITIKGDPEAKITLTNIQGGSAVGVTLGTTAPSHSFTWVPGPENTPLQPGAAAQGIIYAKSSAPQKVTLQADVDTQAIQDSTPNDNKATCTVTVQ